MFWGPSLIGGALIYALQPQTPKGADELYNTQGVTVAGRGGRETRGASARAGSPREKFTTVDALLSARS